jgi:hypothetical protein
VNKKPTNWPVPDQGPDGHHRREVDHPGRRNRLRLRAVIANGDFAEYWRWHLKQELRRNHLDHFQQLDLAA